MDILAYTNLNTLVGITSAALAVIVGVKIKDIGLRLYILVMITAILATAAVIESWFTHSTLIKSATVGWVIGYITDDILLTVNTLMPTFVKDLLSEILDGIKIKIERWLGIDNNR